MARNKVQFQKGLDMAEFQRLYGSEEQCHTALVTMRWPTGFICPKCATSKYSFCTPKRLKTAFPVFGLRTSNLGACRDCFSEIENAADEMVSCHASHDMLQE